MWQKAHSHTLCAYRATDSFPKAENLWINHSDTAGARLRLPPTSRRASELRHFREIEVPHFHCRDYHVERFLATGTDGDAHGFHVGEHMNEALVGNEGCGLRDGFYQFST